MGDVLFPGKKKKRWPIDPLSHLLSKILDKPILVVARLESGDIESVQKTRIDCQIAQYINPWALLRIFERVGHKTSIFFKILCHCPTYHNYEQSQQKLGSFLENNIFKNQSF